MRHDVAIVSGLRTPFAKRLSELGSLAAHELGALVCAELIERQELDPAEVQRVVFGRVIPALDVHNPSREIVLRIGLPAKVEAHTVSKACITGYQALIDMVLAIRAGTVDCGIAGGADSASQVPLGLNETLRDALLRAEAVEGKLDMVKAFAGVRPSDPDQLLIGPAYAIPSVLERAGMELDDLDLVDLHEAFSAAVLSVLEALASDRFARDQLGLASAVGTIDPGRLNVHGGSIALGHPFAATGIRQVLQTLTELKRRGGGLGLCSACAAGGMGVAAIVEAAS